MMCCWAGSRSRLGTCSSTSRDGIQSRPHYGTVGVIIITSEAVAVRGTAVSKEATIRFQTTNLSGGRVALVRGGKEGILLRTLVNVHLIEINAHQDETTANEGARINWPLLLLPLLLLLLQVAFSFHQSVQQCSLSVPTFGAYFHRRRRRCARKGRCSLLRTVPSLPYSCSHDS